jgi:hypothetical protein
MRFDVYVKHHRKFFKALEHMHQIDHEETRLSMQDAGGDGAATIRVYKLPIPSHIRIDDLGGEADACIRVCSDRAVQWGFGTRGVQDGGGDEEAALLSVLGKGLLH